MHLSVAPGVFAASVVASRIVLTEDAIAQPPRCPSATDGAECLIHQVGQGHRCVTINHESVDLPIAALDAAVFIELRDTLGGRTDVVAGLYARFLAHAARYIATLRDQASHTHIATLHTLRGSAAMMGAIRISKLASHLHDASSSCPAPLAQSAVQQLEDELTMFRHALAVHFPE